MTIGKTASVFGEPMLELSSVGAETARLGVGGDTFNTAVYLARAGIDVQYVTAIGDDPMSERIMNALHTEGVGTRYISRVPGKTIGLYAISLDLHGERSFTYWRSDSAFRQWFSPEGSGRARSAMAKSDMIYLSGISLAPFSAEEHALLAHTLEEAQGRGALTAFDMNYRPLGWPSAEAARRAAARIEPYISICLPTFDDDVLLFGLDQPEASLAHWAGSGQREVCVKHGRAGALVSDGSWIAPEEERRPVDTTGAGDSFNAEYLAARLRGEPPQEAARRGNQLAGRVIMSKGAVIPRD